MYRTGIGYDVHRLADGYPLILGGVHIPFDKGLLGHSDADVLLHAIIDAMLGAAAMGDIGKLFPDTDPRFKGISSLLLLQEAAIKLDAAGFEIVNIDSTIVAQKPRLFAYTDTMKMNIAGALGLDSAPDRINVKATTEEGLGFTGALQGISAMAVCMVMVK